MMLTRFCTICCAIFFICFHISLPAYSQTDIPVGTWRTHEAYRQANQVLATDDRVLAASPNGLWYVDTQENSVNVLSKVNRLSDSGVSAMAYLFDIRVIALGYRNGNIDLLLPDQTINIRTLLNSRLPSKTIRHITAYRQFAYLSGGFGLIVLNVAEQEIVETYANIGANAAQIPVDQSVVWQDSLIVATPEGIKGASLSPSINRLDFRNWRNIVPASALGIRQLVATEQGLFFIRENDGLYRYRNGLTERIPISITFPVGKISLVSSKLYIPENGRIWEYDPVSGTSAAISRAEIPAPAQVAGKDGQLWIADGQRGLLRLANGQVETFTPEGIYSGFSFALRANGGKLFNLTGGFGSGGAFPLNRNVGFDVFEQGDWTAYAPFAAPDVVQIPDLADWVDAVYLPDRQLAYLASFGEGLTTWNLADQTFTTLRGVPLESNLLGKFPISSLDLDDEGRLWVANFGVRAGRPSFHSLDASGQWQSFNIAQSVARFPLQILVDNVGQKWARISPANGGGVLVFQNANSFRYLTEGVGRGDLPSGEVYSMVEDLNGSIWLGTAKGVVEFFLPSEVISGNLDGVVPRFEGFPLLRDEKITALAVDPGNRKWIGTENGLWLFSADGSELIHHFTTNNSPLPSNVIQSVAVLPQSGEVFVSTDQGLVSYRGSAAEGFYRHQQVRVFPNPVRPGYQGLVSIDGLSYNGNVRITDIAGRLVKEINSAGGRAVWDLTDYQGHPVFSGVYLFFSTSIDGQETFVGKIAVIK